MRARGFTMVEVLVAIAIFALAAIVLGASYVNVLNAYASASGAGLVDEELRFARSQLMAQGEREEAEEGARYQTAEGGAVTWRALIEPTDLPDLYDVFLVVEISRANGTPPEVIEQTIRLLRPSWAEGTENETRRTELRDRILEYQGKLKEGTR